MWRVARVHRRQLISVRVVCGESQRSNVELNTVSATERLKLQTPRTAANLRPAPIAGRMSQKATKPGFVFWGIFCVVLKIYTKKPRLVAFCDIRPAIGAGIRFACAL